MFYNKEFNQIDRYIENILVLKDVKAFSDIGKGLLVVKNKFVGRSITDVMEQYGFDVDHVTTGLDALKLIQAKNSYSVLVTQLILDQISGMALMMELKKKQPVFALGINNRNATCRSIASVSGFDVIVDAGANPTLICQYLLNQVARQIEQSENC